MSSRAPPAPPSQLRVICLELEIILHLTPAKTSLLRALNMALFPLLALVLACTCRGASLKIGEVLIGVAVTADRRRRHCAVSRGIQATPLLAPCRPACSSIAAAASTHNPGEAAAAVRRCYSRPLLLRCPPAAVLPYACAAAALR